VRVLTEHPYLQKKIKRMTVFNGDTIDITGCTNILCEGCRKHSVSRCDAVKPVNGFAKFELNWSWVDDRRHRKGKVFYRHDWCRENELSAEAVELTGGGE